MADGQIRDPDFAVIGGGLVGVAIGWGLARLGRRVTILDEGDVAFRASRGNFSLVWVQSKGLGMPRYAAWTKLSSDSWGLLAEILQQDTAIDVQFRAIIRTQCGGDTALGPSARCAGAERSG